MLHRSWPVRANLVRGERETGPATREVVHMSKKRRTPEEIIQHLRTIKLEAGKGLAVRDACRQLGITELTYYQWK